MMRSWVNYVWIFNFLIFGVYIGLIIGKLGYSSTQIVEVPVYYNNIIERIEVQECELSCLDARNEGYLDGLSDSAMREMMITSREGRLRSYVDNPEGFYSTDGVICVNTQGRSDDHILAVVVHELIERGVYTFELDHFCSG